MSIDLTVEIHGLCALLMKGKEGTRVACLAGGHAPVLTVPTSNLLLTPNPQYAADRVIVVNGTQYAEWDLAGCAYDLGDKAKGPATMSNTDQNIFSMQAGYSQLANASADAWDGPLGKLIATRMSLYGGVIQPAATKLAKLTLAPMKDEPDYSHTVTEVVSFTAPGAPDTIDLGNGKTVPLRGPSTISISNFGRMLENTQFAHLEMYHALLQDQNLPYRAAQSPLPSFVFPMDCVPPTFFNV